MKKMLAGVLSTAILSLAAACGGVPLAPSVPPTAGDLTEALGLKEIPYIRDDTFLGNPLLLLGQVVEVRKKDGVCPVNVDEGSTEFSIEPLQGFKIDESSIIKTPNKRNSQLVTKELAASVSFLSYLSASFDTQSVFSIILFDQSGARVLDNDASWNAAIKAWRTAHQDLFDDTNICYLWVVKGMVQKNVIRRKFDETKASAGGGAYGVNVAGKYHTSSEDYAVDVKFGLSPGILKRPSGIVQGLDTGTLAQTAPTESEIKLLAPIQTIGHKKR